MGHHPQSGAVSLSVVIAQKPNQNIGCRYTLKCNCNLVGSLQLQTSKSEAVVLFKVGYIRLTELSKYDIVLECILMCFSSFLAEDN